MHTITKSFTPEILSGSVGRFGTGMKPKLPKFSSFRPAAAETATSLVWNAPGPNGAKEPLTLTADLVVLTPHEDGEVVMEEEEPEMNTPVGSVTSGVSIRDILQGRGQSVKAQVKQFQRLNAQDEDRAVQSPDGEIQDAEQPDVSADLVLLSPNAPADEQKSHHSDSDIEERHDSNEVEETKDEAEDDENLSSKAEATKRNKRSFFNTSMFSMSKRKTTPQVPPNNDEVEGSAKVREMQEMDVTDRSAGAGVGEKEEVVEGNSLALPSLTSGMGLTEAFEEAEPGEFVCACVCVWIAACPDVLLCLLCICVLCASLSSGKTYCVWNTHTYTYTHTHTHTASQQAWQA